LSFRKKSKIEMAIGINNQKKPARAGEEGIMGFEYAETHKGLLWANVEQLDRCALEKGGIWGSIGWGSDLAGKLPPLPGGWKAVWIDRHGMGNHGAIILIPTDERTCALSKTGWIGQLVRWGLPRDEAEKFITSLGGDHPWRIFPLLRGGDEVWEDVLKIHKTSQEITEHRKGKCECFDEDGDRIVLLAKGAFSENGQGIQCPFCGKESQVYIESETSYFFCQHKGCFHFTAVIVLAEKVRPGDDFNVIFHDGEVIIAPDENRHSWFDAKGTKRMAGTAKFPCGCIASGDYADLVRNRCDGGGGRFGSFIARSCKHHRAEDNCDPND
jgi:hypothetical protein